MQNISSVASGGEIARVMLSVKAMIAGAVKLPTIVFDEIDTGVSGEIADRMADIMQEMGDSDRQVISITHLPQIAARGRAHYKVYKQDNETETNSHIRRLTDEERVGEIAHMRVSHPDRCRAEQCQGTVGHRLTNVVLYGCKVEVYNRSVVL